MLQQARNEIHSQKLLSSQVGHCLEKSNIYKAVSKETFSGQNSFQTCEFSAFPGDIQEKQGVSNKFTRTEILYTKGTLGNGLLLPIFS